jgi:alkylated DNA repair dioxygenase AlkB
MSVAVQDSLLDFGDEPTPAVLRPERVPLSHGAWIDVQRGWLAGSAALFGRLVEAVPWKAERRRMYDRTVDVPRLLRFYGADEALPDRALDVCRDALNAHYQAELGERFITAGLCFYRDGRDSVAWHGDRNRHVMTRPLVATVSLGARRRFLLRRRGTTRATHVLEPGGGDLVVMGGDCQAEWEHTVPKTARHVGVRMSVTIRHSEPAPGERWLKRPSSMQPGHAW